MFPQNAHIRWLLGGILLLVPGCAQWKNTDAKLAKWELPAVRMPPDTVVIEVAFVRSTPEIVEALEEMWREVDEQVLTPHVRRQLNANGLRCGVLGAQLPSLVVERLAEQSADSGFNSPNLDQQDREITQRQYRLQCREGQRSVIATTETKDLLNVFVHEDGVVRGATYQKAQCIFGMRAYPLGDGRVRVELLPEIEHGAPRNRRIGTEGAWRLDFSRDHRSFEFLQIHATLAPGQTLVISSTPDAVGLGESFFRKETGESTLLLIRVAQIQRDDLFEKNEQLTPIASRAE